MGIYLAVEFDDQIQIHLEGDIFENGHCFDGGGELSGVPFKPVGDLVSGVLLHVFAKNLVNAFLEGDGLAGLDEEAGDVSLGAVHDDVAMSDDLAGGPDGAADAKPAEDVIEAAFENLHQGVGGVALGFFGDIEEAAELLFVHAIVVAELLLFTEADAVFGVSAAAIAMHAGEFEFSAGGVLGDVGDGDTDATGQLELGTGIAAHGNSLSTGDKKARLKTCAAAAMADDLHAVFQSAWF